MVLPVFGQDRREQAQRLIWLVRAGALLLILGIGLFQFVLTSDWSAALLPPNLRASLNIIHDGDGRFEFSFAMLSGKVKAPDEPARHVASPGTTAEAVSASAGTSGSSSVTSPGASKPGDTSRSSDKAAAIGPEATACSLPSPAQGATNDGKLMRASFSMGPDSIDAYGVNDIALPTTATPQRLPGYTLPVLKWVRSQGALAGYRNVAAAAPARGMSIPLPNLMGTVPGIGTDDFVMSIAHDAVDFLSVGTGDFASELNLWYHSLNAGFRTQIIADAPCEKVVPPAMNGARSNIQAVSISASRRTMKSNSLYVSDGRSQISEFKVAGHRPAIENGAEVRLAAPGGVNVTAVLSARLKELGTDEAEVARSESGWNIENARIPNTQTVAVEVVVNGAPVASKPVIADGKSQAVTFNIPIAQSSWVALRLVGAAHSNPVFVLVDNMPVRASRSSVEWSVRSLIEAYQAANTRWAASESADARAAYKYSYAVYQKILSETSSP